MRSPDCLRLILGTTKSLFRNKLFVVPKIRLIMVKTQKALLFFQSFFSQKTGREKIGGIDRGRLLSPISSGQGARELVCSGRVARERRGHRRACAGGKGRRSSSARQPWRTNQVPVLTCTPARFGTTAGSCRRKHVRVLLGRGSCRLLQPLKVEAVLDRVRLEQAERAPSSDGQRAIPQLGCPRWEG